MVYAKNSVPIEAIPNESSDSARQRLYENSPNSDRVEIPDPRIPIPHSVTDCFPPDADAPPE